MKFYKQGFKYFGNIYRSSDTSDITVVYDTGAAITTVREEDLIGCLGYKPNLTSYMDIVISGYTDSLNLSNNKNILNRVGKLVGIKSVSVCNIVVPKLFMVIVSSDIKYNLLGCDFISACDGSASQSEISISSFDNARYLQNMKELLEACGKLSSYLNGYLDTCCIDIPDDGPVASACVSSSFSKLLQNAKRTP